MPEWFCLIYSTPAFSSFFPNTKEHPLNSLGFTGSCLSICCLSFSLLLELARWLSGRPPANAGDVGLIPGLPSREDPLEEGMVTHSSILAEKSCRQRSLVGYGPWVAESDMTECLNTSTHSGLLPRRHRPPVGSGGATLILPHLLSFFPRLLLLLCHLLYILF